MKKHQPGNCSPRYVQCRHERLERHRVRRQNRYVFRSGGRTHRKKTKKIGGVTYDVTQLPEVFSLTENYHKSINKINEIKNFAQKRDESNYIDFDHIKEIGVGAALVLAAELHVANINTIGRKAWTRASDKNWHPEVRELLHDIGFYDLLELQRDIQDNRGRENSDEEFLKFQSGRVGSENTGKTIVKLTEEIGNKLLGKKLSRDMIFKKGINEAILNTDHHAYPKTEKSRDSARWWVSASLDKTKNEIKVICYDRGLSIPKTLRANPKDYLKSFFASVRKFENKHEPLLIEAAMQKNKSSSGIKGRGNGLLSLREFIDENNKGSLIVMSRYGKVTYRKSGAETVWHTEKLPEKLNGTLIVWSIIRPDEV